MPQLTEAAAERLPQAQAVVLARVIDLQARWENLRDHPGRPNSEYDTPDLHARQRAYEAFRVARADYEARYRAAESPETTHNTPDRVAAWCRAVRAVLRRAGAGECPAAAVEKAYRMTDRAAARVKGEPVGRGPLGDMADAIGALDAVIRWCDALAGPAGRVVRV